MPNLLSRLVILALVASALSACVTATPMTEQGRPTFAGRTVVVTGASSGFGRGIALAFGERGAAVVLAARRADQLEQVAAQIRASGGRALAVPTDVADPAAIERLAGAATAAFGRVDVWVSDAGVASLGRFEAVPVSDHARVIDVNLKGLIYGSHAALTLFKRQGAGVLINMGSTESHVPLPYQASYVASKFAILGLDSAIAEELRLEHATAVHVVTIEPWAADTPF